jgi:tellurite resistance protein
MSLIESKSREGAAEVAGQRIARSVWFRPRIPPNYFAIPFGLVGLAAAWDTAAPTLHTSAVVPDAINILAGAVWLTLVLLHAARGVQSALADLRDPVLAPFIPVAAIVGMLLGWALSAYSFTAGRVVVAVFLAITVLIGGWMTGQWIVGDLDQDKLHPGYFLPTVAGCLVGAFCAAEVHLHAIGEASFGIGIICWVLLGSLVLNRLFFRPTLPAALLPTLAIELAPPAVAGEAYFALGGRASSPVACVLGGYVVLMALVQLRFLPVYAKLSFSPAFWAFTFAYASAAADGLDWINQKRPPGAAAYAATIIAAITLFIGVIAIRTVNLLIRGELLVRPASPASSRAARLP